MLVGTTNNRDRCIAYLYEHHGQADKFAVQLYVEEADAEEGYWEEFSIRELEADFEEFRRALLE